MGESWKCPICEYAARLAEGEEKPKYCRQCNTSHAQAEETLLLSSAGYYLDGRRAAGNRMFLTTKRIFVLGPSSSQQTSTIVGGVVGGAVGHMIAQAGDDCAVIEFGLLVSEFAQVKLGRVVFRKGLHVHTKRGECFKFLPAHLAEWTSALAQYMV